MNKEFLKMQKSAGLITESEYKGKLSEIEDYPDYYVPNKEGAGLDSILRTLEFIYNARANGDEVNLKQIAADIIKFVQK